MTSWESAVTLAIFGAVITLMGMGILAVVWENDNRYDSDRADNGPIRRRFQFRVAIIGCSLMLPLLIKLILTVLFT